MNPGQCGFFVGVFFFFLLTSEAIFLNSKIPAYRAKIGMKVFVLLIIRLGNEKIAICGSFLMIKCQNRQFLRYSAASVRKKK